MSKMNVLLLAVGLTGVVAVSTACNSGPKWDAVCENLGEVMEMEMNDAVCSAMETEITDDCGDDTDTAMACILAAEDMEGIGNCYAACAESQSE